MSDKNARGNEQDSIYQVKPRKPNFLLILVLSGVTIVVFFAATFLFFSETGKKVLLHMYRQSGPTSSLSVPSLLRSVGKQTLPVCYSPNSSASNS